MNRLSRTIAVGAAVGLTAMMTQLAPAANAARPATERAAAPMITAKMTKNSIKLSDDSVRAGKIMFMIKSLKGNHIFQLLRIHPGYTPQQLQQDINKAFKGDLDAIARVDDNVTWLGGAEAKPGSPGSYEIKLKAGSYFAVDQNGNGAAVLTVTGSVQKRSGVKTHGEFTTLTYGFQTYGMTHAKGWVKANNRSDQPHFIELQHVKKGTTRQQVVRALQKQGQPSFALKGSTGLGVISPGQTLAWHIDLPKGRYAMMCFWPDRFMGMPHAFMGMVDMVNLK